MNAINAYNNLKGNIAGLKKASEKLSSGYRINRAGDDAAGLAVSEKMRSQIKGLNQAIRNSQDGINMIQTFEGAAQETHSILQRMKELATESANGTYDNATDRAAMQLEFDHLNDELNQIADTDFNGTIVLNGGVMSDGLKVTNFKNGIGDFDYANKASQVAAANAAEINRLTQQMNAINAPADVFKNATNKAGDLVWNTLDEHEYDATAAEAAWDSSALDLDRLKDEYIDITFEATVDDKGDATWKAVDGVTSRGTSVDAATLQANVTATAKNGTTAITGKGGFEVAIGGATVNAIFDSTNIKTGDVLTIRFDGPGAKPAAPTNAGIGDDTPVYSEGVTPGTLPTVKIDTGLDDDAMTKDINAILDAFNGAQIVATSTATTEAPASVAKLAMTTADGGTVTLSADGAVTWTDGDGTAHAKFAHSKFEDGKLVISSLGTDGASADTAIFEVDMSKIFTNTVAGDKTATFTIHWDSNAYPEGTGVDAKPLETNLGAEVAEAKKQKDALQKQIDDIKNGVNNGVSKSDFYDNSTARLTYNENITLQTGARSKDAVNFTFNYNMNDEVDMRGLENNLNLSSRKEGLNTANLSIARQDDANYAMDQIDKAINKVSMVRATFGAIQNRLEHKINNLTVNTENLTEAESSIRDTDMASEMMNYTKYNILQQAAQSMLAQANQQPQSILQLLG